MKTYPLMKMLFFSLLLVPLGCKDDDILVNTDTVDDNRLVEIAAPAGELTYKISDFLEDIDNEYVFVDEEGLVNARYTQEVDIEWESLVTLNDFAEYWSFPLSDLPLLSGQVGTVAGDFVEKVQLNTREDVRYDTIFMDGGILQATLTLPYWTTGTVTVSIPEILSNGQPLEYSFDANGTYNVFDIYESLSGLKVIPSQAQDSSYLSVITSVDLENAEIGVVELNFSLKDMTPGLTFGYFGQQTASKSDQTLTFDVFDDLEVIDEIEFYDLKLNLEITSGIGVPFDVKVDNMQFFEDDGTFIDRLTVNGDPYIDLFMEPAVYGDPVENSVTTFDISRENSGNIVDIVNSYPERMVFDVTSTSNPERETGVLNFMGPDNILRGKMNVILPAWFNTSDYERTDTVDFDIHDIVGEDEENVREIEEFIVWFDFYSRIPVDIVAAAWVIDAQGNPIDDMLLDETNVIAAGDPEQEEPAHSEFSASISGDQINEYFDRNAMEIVIQTKYKTPVEQEYIKIYENMDFRAVVSFEGAGRIPSF